MKESIDVVIAGGGLAGLTMACALAEIEVSVALIEPRPYPVDQPPEFDERTTALSYGAKDLFQVLGVWPALAARAEPIRHIHVSDQGSFGITRLHADDYGLDALGYVVENRHLLQVMLAHVRTLKNVTFFNPDAVTEIVSQETGLNVSLSSHRAVSTRLLIGADGTQTVVGEKMAINQSMKDYRQYAIVTNVTTEKAHRNWAFERFISDGPLACLPMPGLSGASTSAVVLTVTADQIDQVMGLDNEDFKALLLEKFSRRLGRFLTVGSRQKYPLTLRWCERPIAERTVLIGNAAQTLHPVAGQGFNLGLRDIAALTAMIMRNHYAGVDIGDEASLNAFCQERAADRKRTINLGQGLLNIFKADYAVIRRGRSLGLLAMDVVPECKAWFARYGMGLGRNWTTLERTRDKILAKKNQ